MTPYDPTPSAIVREGETLGQLAKQINAAHTAGEAALDSVLGLAREAGELLIRAKKLVPHGEWLAWIKANFPFSQQTASVYMRIAANWHLVSQAKSLQDALRILNQVSAGESELLETSNLEAPASKAQEGNQADVDDGVAND